jgi:hypothetical protein
MPARHHIIAIVAFWLATMGWLFHKSLRPLFSSAQPPPFAIDLADEVQARSVYWTVFKNGQDAGTATSWVRPQEKEGTYEVAGVFRLWRDFKKRGTQPPDQSVESMYRVTREGELRAIDAVVTVIPDKDHEVRARIYGEVKDGRFTPRVEITSSAFNLERQMAPVEVNARGSVLNPLQPVNRLPGVRKGQRWRMPLVDPLAEVLGKAAEGAGFGRKSSIVRFLDAEVLPDSKALQRVPSRPSEMCLVIEYTGDGITARTWVRERDGIVLRQEITQDGENLVLVRDVSLNY